MSSIDLARAEEVLETAETRGYRSPGVFWKVVAGILTIIGLVSAIDQLYFINLFAYLGLPSLQFRKAFFYFMFACFLPLAFVLLPATKKASKQKVPWYDTLFFSVTLLTCSYLATQAWSISQRGWDLVPPLHVGIAAVILCVVVAEALRRAGGYILFIACLLFAFLPSFSGHLPGILKGPQFSLWDVAVFHALGSSSLMGILAQVYADLLIGFLLFGSVLVVSGGATAFSKFAVALLGTQKGGPAKVSIIASALFGTMSGSIISNIITTGSFTIPTMKKAGYPGHFAGAIEACASTGGCIMPPVMGATAFLIASFLGISYFSVCIAAAIPALLYYFALFVQVHCYAVAHDLRGLPPSEIPSLREALSEIWPYFLCLAVLIYFLYLGLEARAPIWASVVLIALAMLRKKTRLNLTGFNKLLTGLTNQLPMMLALLIGIGFIIGSASMTGLDLSFASEIKMVAGNNVTLLLGVGALAAIVLGMAVTLTAVYVLLVIAVVPALTGLGFHPLAVHLYVFYWALCCNFTPPVAIGAYVAADLAKASPIKTAFTSMRLAILMYTLPFYFVLSPALILKGPLSELATSLSTIVLGVVLVGAGIERYLIKVGILPTPYRIATGIAGVLLLIPGWQTDVAGLALFLLTMAVYFGMKKRRRL